MDANLSEQLTWDDVHKQVVNMIKERDDLRQELKAYKKAIYDISGLVGCINCLYSPCAAKSKVKQCLLVENKLNEVRKELQNEKL